MPYVPTAYSLVRGHTQTQNGNNNKKSETTSATIIITEGKYHQVKKMFELVGHPVIKLKRVRFGFVDLKNLGVGEYRLLKPHEYKKLLNLVDTEE